MEQIAMDMGNLLVWQFPGLAGRACELRDKGLVVCMRSGGQLLLQELGLEALSEAPTWSSDTARGWAAMAVGQAPGLSFAERIALMRPFADDPHFAVREWAWLAARGAVAADVQVAIGGLRLWTSASSERLRRFTTEATRPRGVWSSHLPLLKQQPELGLLLLEPLRADPARYVQDSAANWLNDAAKTRPDWVRSVCQRWQAESAELATLRICQRAQRSLRV
jgi:3-methyladenine DNA glycosylase AlkC